MEVEGENTLTKHDAHGDDDDPPMLSSHALEALKEFFAEQNQTLTDSTSEIGGSEVALVAEDWRLREFWYDPLTAVTVAEEVLTLCKSSNYRVACIACPTLYANLKLSLILQQDPTAVVTFFFPLFEFQKIDPNVTAQLLEYDKRFEQYGSDFTFYDYNQPEKLPSALKHAFQVLVVDPPYLWVRSSDNGALWKFRGRAIDASWRKAYCHCGPDDVGGLFFGINGSQPT